MEDYQSKIAELEKALRRKERENSRLTIAIEQEKVYANARANMTAAHTIAQRVRDRYLQLLLDNSKDTIICFDNAERIVFCSSAIIKQGNLEEGAESGKKIDELLNGIWDENFIYGFNSRLSKVLSDNESINFQAEASLDGSDEKRKFQINFIPMSSSQAGIEGAMAIFHDVTDIERAREDAERASAAKSEFLSNMSHEMRTPMNAIIGMTAIARDSDSMERKEYCLNKIEDASTHLLGVINDILDMSKIEANKLELSFECFNFEKMIQKVVNVINFRVDEKNQVFTVKLDKAIPNSLFGDDQRISQIITNFLSNAVKFTPPGGVISLNASLKSEENGFYTTQIEVIDSGIGISDEELPRLFASFEQAESGTSRKFGGTGLGLPISKRLVELMGGEIWVESEIGIGSTFAFTFPAEQCDSGNETRLSSEISWDNVRILVVDDAPETLEYFRGEAERLNIKCDLALSGEEGISLIEKNGAYDIYFIDWKMPGMNGIEVASRVKKIDVNKSSMVIMISGVDWNVIEEEAKKAGVDRYLQKPLFHSDIVDCLNGCFGIDRVKMEKAQEKNYDFSGSHILLVEDVEINREIVLALLEPTSISIDCAVNGVEAVKMFINTGRPYDMIFMDMQMPEMDGLEATRRIREYEALQINQPLQENVLENAPEMRMENAEHSPRLAGRPQGVPIIAMTANVFREDVEKCLEAGMNDHIGKPLDMEEVMEKLWLYLKTKPQEQVNQ